MRRSLVDTFVSSYEYWLLQQRVCWST